VSVAVKQNLISMWSSTRQALMPSTAYRYVRYLNDDGSLDKWVPGLLETKSARNVF
jgi:GH25 family lysozyme M1 (1,4-beta-N-acetylmuramidase)